MTENKPVNGETATVTSGETQAFLHPKPTTVEIKDTKSKGSACLGSFGCKICAITTAVFGCIFILIGILALAGGKGYLEKKILASMALTPGSDRFESWLRPPVQAHLTGYAWHITNPDQVLAGAKPILEEKGPYTYKSVTIKDADDNIKWSDDNTELVYRPRKVYTYVPELSGEGLDPWKDMITVPNIPLWTGLNSLRGKSGTAKGIGRSLVTENGLGTPFVTVSFNGLLWGYNDELPCLKLDFPSGCASADESSPFDSGSDDDWGDDDWKRKKRSVDDEDYYEEFEAFENPDEDENSEWYGKALPKAEFVDCKCEWGLFRDRNVTMRNPLRIFTGVDDLSVKGVVKRYNGKKTLGWWQEGSTCDKVKGQDSSTLPPGLTREDKLDVFVDLMCRGMPMEFEQDETHADIKTLRYIPPLNAMGAHDDANPAVKNTENECYCMEDEGFECFKSGVLNMEPCKRDTHAPLALSFPHFYEADQSFRDAVEGMKPNKTEHQFYMDVVPEFGFPLAIRPRFQLNIVIGSATDEWKTISRMQPKIVVPFLWAQDGFSEPSEEMAEAIRFGLAAPDKLPLFIAVVCFIIGAILAIFAMTYFIWMWRETKGGDKVAQNNGVQMTAMS